MKSTRLSCEFCNDDEAELIAVGVDDKGVLKVFTEDLSRAEFHVCELHEAELRRALNERLADNVTRGVYYIALERQRQITEECYSFEHDDEHRKGELTQAAAYYAVSKEVGLLHVSIGWPFGDDPSTDHTRIEELAKAGALIAAEIDRLLRAEKNKSGE